jgi:hypothetical protein
MLEDNQPLDKINAFINEVKQRADKKESFGRDIGSQLHDWIDIYFKSKKEPVITRIRTFKNNGSKMVKVLEITKVQSSC